MAVVHSIGSNFLLILGVLVNVTNLVSCGFCIFHKDTAKCIIIKLPNARTFSFSCIHKLGLTLQSYG